MNAINALLRKSPVPFLTSFLALLYKGGYGGISIALLRLQ
jgi:hypothetical protein